MIQPKKPTDMQQTLESVRNQHKELLSQMEKPEGADVDQVRTFLKTLAKAGTTIEDVENRSRLLELIGYWSSFINNKTGEYPVVQLQPYDASIIRQRALESPELPVEGIKMSRRQVLIGSGIAGGLLVVGGIVYWEAGRNKPPAPSPTPTPTSSPPTAAPTPSSGAIFVGDILAPGYDLALNTSGGLTNWVTVKNSEICMAYPSGQSWGTVYITVGKPTQPPRPGKDFSNFHQLSLELRGQTGGESVSIGIKDNSQPDDGSETKVPVSGLTTDWKLFVFPLSQFTGVDLSNLYVVIEFVFAAKEETVCARNILYLR